VSAPRPSLSAVSVLVMMLAVLAYLWREDRRDIVRLRSTIATDSLLRDNLRADRERDMRSSTLSDSIVRARYAHGP
jgi:hypothetical protein